jgi:hypothetical protein
MIPSKDVESLLVPVFEDKPPRRFGDKQTEQKLQDRRDTLQETGEPPTP